MRGRAGRGEVIADVGRADRLLVPALGARVGPVAGSAVGARGVGLLAVPVLPALAGLAVVPGRPLVASPAFVAGPAVVPGRAFVPSLPSVRNNFSSVFG